MSGKLYYMLLSISAANGYCRRNSSIPTTSFREYRGWRSARYRSSCCRDDYPMKCVYRRITSLIFLIFTIIISLFFILTAFRIASKKDLWGDEKTGLSSSNSSSYIGLIMYGARYQGSRAPLDYIALKVLHQIREFPVLIKIPHNIYYRLNSIFFALSSGLFVIFIAHKKVTAVAGKILITGFQLSLLILALMVYYFWPHIFNFYVEMRPYALWYAIWFSLVSLYMIYGKLDIASLILWSLLAATATAAIYQISCFISCYAIIRLFKKEKLLLVLKTVLQIFTIPIFICFYYIFAFDWSFAYEGSDIYLKQFFDFWTHKEMIPLLSILGFAASIWIGEVERSGVIFLTFLVLYIISPVINYITLYHNFFFSSRQYIYYEVIYPVLLIHAALFWPKYIQKLKKSFDNVQMLWN